MRFLYISLTGYAGLYNGSGLETIEIDFTKCKNKITVISGPNGTGKSTIINALNILPDSNDSFMSGRNASKIIKLISDEGHIYDIQIIHPLDKHGNRATTRATIQKDGVELNTSGNVSQYKEIIFAEFDMDSNYIELFKISGDKRGLSDKTPAERKKFMASLISSLDVYNSIYKNLNKKANIFKSYINTLTSKIQNIGDETNLRMSLSSLDTREKQLNETISANKEEIVRLQTIIAMDDPDGSMSDEYDFIKDKCAELEKTIKDQESSGFPFFDDVTQLEKRKNDLKIAEANREVINQQKIALVELSSQYTEDINKLQARLEKLSSSIGGEDLESKIKEHENSIRYVDDAFREVGVEDVDAISADEMNHTIEIIHNITEAIDNLYQDTDCSNIDKDFNDASGINKLIDSCEKDIKKLTDEIEETTASLGELKATKGIADVLSNRPKECKIDSCPFISSAVNLFSKYGDINLAIERLENVLAADREQIAGLEELIENKKIRLSTISQVQSVTNMISLNLRLLKKFRITTRILDVNTFLSCLSSGYNFNELRTLSQYNDLANEIILYKTNKKNLEQLRSQYTIYLANKNQVDDMMRDIEEKQNKKTETINKINDLQAQYNNEGQLIAGLNDRITNTEFYFSIKESYKEFLKKREEFEKKFATSLENMNKICICKNNIDKAQQELNPLSDTRKSIESQLTLLSSYAVEYEQYKVKYDVVNKLRGYSSPTSDSIQALFMSIYMDKTLDMVNQLLQMMFGGQYRIMQYVINDSEFRIPFIGNGFPVDDISSGSTSQKCMMGMIINLVLSSISSGKYNIVSLDEIDGGLDDANRYMFVDVLQRISEMLRFEQIFIISHSVESALNNVDVVLLSNDQVYLDQFGNSNIIFRR